MMKQVLIGAAILALSVFAAMMLIANRSSPPQRPPENRAPLVLTAPAVVESGVLTVTGSGTVRPRAEVALATQVSGKVTFVSPSLVSGAFVRKGETLVALDRAEFDNAVEQARADVAQQEVTVLQAKEESAIARAEYARFSDRESRREGASTSPQTEEPGGLVFREPQLRAAEAALQRSRAILANAELSSSRTVVRAPFSGFVRSKNVAVGSFLSPGQSFAQVVASDIFEISVPMTRQEAALIPDLWNSSAGSAKRASVFAEYGGLKYRWPAYIDRAEAVLDPQTRTINVVVRVPSPVTSGEIASDGLTASPEGTPIVSSQAPPLLVGEYVTVELDGAALERYLVIPRGALKGGDTGTSSAGDAGNTGNTRNTVWVVRDGAIEIIPVEVLQQVEEQAYIVADTVRDGDPIVISDLTVATPGMRVRTDGSSTNN